MKLMPLVIGLVLSAPPIAVIQSTPAAPQIRDVASGAGFTLVVKADGTVVGWGRNTEGQSAQPNAPRGSVASPIVIDLPGKVLQVAMSDLSQYALLEDGTVMAWGQNDEGNWATDPWARPASWAATRSHRSRRCA